MNQNLSGRMPHREKQIPTDRRKRKGQAGKHKNFKVLLCKVQQLVFDMYALALMCALRNVSRSTVQREILLSVVWVRR